MFVGGAPKRRRVEPKGVKSGVGVASAGMIGTSSIYTITKVYLTFTYLLEDAPDLTEHTVVQMIPAMTHRLRDDTVCFII
jgi:hypothetical protein